MTHADLSQNGLADTVWREKVSPIDRMPRWLAMLLLFVLAVGIWALATGMGWVSSVILPSPLETLKDLIFVGQNMATGDYMMEALLITARTLMWAFGFAIVIGVSLGIVVGETKFGERALLPYLVAIDTMPKIAFAPLFIAWLGFDIASKVALAAFIATFPIVVSTAAGLHAASENERMLFKSIGATRWQTLIRLKIPSGLPHIFTGLKIAAVGVMAGVITGEFLGGGKGFGALIRQAASQMNTPRVFALILYLSLLGLLLYFLVVWAQRQLVFWKKEERVGAIG